MLKAVDDGGLPAREPGAAAEAGRKPRGGWLRRLLAVCNQWLAELSA